MARFTSAAFLMGLSLLALGCGSDDTRDPLLDSGVSNLPPFDAGGSSLPEAGGGGAPDAAAQPPSPASDSGGVSTPDANVPAQDSAAPPAQDSAVAVDAASEAATADASASGGTVLTGMLGALGPVKPTVSGFVISNSGETLVYLTSAPLTCETLKMSRWLGGFSAGAQVVEVVIKGAPKVGTPVNVGVFMGEVNYAAGGKSSAYEVVASSGSITFTKSEPMGVVEGTVTATYPMGSVMGTFHAEFCAGGQGY